MDKEFKDIGKKMPYTVPDGFFEAITQATLEKARRRAGVARKRRLLIQWVAAAAVLTGIVFTGIRLLDPPAEVPAPMIAGTPLEIPAPEAITLPYSEPSALKEIPPAEKGVASAESAKSVDSKESMDELLASIPDEELLDWATLIRSDPFFEETENNQYHEDN